AEYLRAVAFGETAANEPSQIFHSLSPFNVLEAGRYAQRDRISRRCCPSFTTTGAGDTRPVRRPTASVATRSHGIRASGSREMTVAIEMPEPIPPAAAACPALSFSRV